MRALFYLFSRFGALVYLMRHPRVPLWVKAIPVLALFYVVWPRDLILDFPPGIGHIDDFVVVLLLTNLFFWLAPKYAQRPAPPAHDGRTVQADFHVLEGDEPDVDPNAETDAGDTDIDDADIDDTDGQPRR